MEKLLTASPGNLISAAEAVKFSFDSKVDGAAGALKVYASVGDGAWNEF